MSAPLKKQLLAWEMFVTSTSPESRSLCVVGLAREMFVTSTLIKEASAKLISLHFLTRLTFNYETLPQKKEQDS